MEPVVHVLYPLLYMHSVYSNMIDKVYRHMEVTWSVFVQADNGQLVVMRSEPHVFMSSDVEDVSENLPWMDDKTSMYMETNIAGQDNSATPLLNYRASQMKSARSDDALNLDVEAANFQSDGARSDWLSCVARKTGIARIILCFLILATAIVMIWFCLTAAATAPEVQLSINGDLEYLRTMSEKEGFKLLHPQARVEARPLPIKIRVEQI
nr:hypothetical protein BaRGS_034153 [Batillaria attramentaria]